jgi:radical SAM superfamily enzyme YgiQ (UPF0313 family)
MIRHVALLVPTLFDLRSYRFEPWQHNKAARFHPLGAMYLAGYLRHHLPGIQFSIFDANVELPLYYRNHPELIEAPDVDAGEVLKVVLQEHLKQRQPEVIGVSGLFHSVLHQFHFLAQTAKQCLPESRIICGGPYPSGSPQMVLRDRSIDYIVKGEGELRTYHLIRYLQGEIALENLDGIVYRNGSGEISEVQLVELPKVEQKLDLDYMPYPARDLLRQDEYTGFSSERSSDYLWRRRDYLVAAIYASRGCPMRCSYCNSGTSNYYGPKFRWQSVESVIEEVKCCIENYGIQEMQFYDENITANQRHTFELFSALNDLPINWTFGTLELEKLERRSLLEYTKKKKFSWFSVGMESGNDRVLKEVAWRKASRASMIEQMRILRGVVSDDCFVNASFILGFPGEKISEMLDTVEFAKIVGIDWAAFFCYMPLPGTPLHELCVRKGYLDESTVDYGNIRAEVSVLNTPDWTAEQVTRIRNWANYEVNFVHNHNIVDHTHKAIRGFEYVLTVAPDHLFAFYALGECYLQLGDSEKAQEFFSKAQQLVSRPPYCGYLDYFNLPHIGRYRRQDLVPHFSDGNNDTVQPVSFFIPVPEIEFA